MRVPRPRRLALAATGIVTLAAAAAVVGPTGSGEAARRSLTASQRAHVSGVVGLELRQPSALEERTARQVGQTAARRMGLPLRTRGLSSNVTPDARSLGCSDRFGSNVRENQNCVNISDADLLGRGQAQNETAIAADPTTPGRLVAGANDYRRGDGSCGSYFSTDGARTWGDELIPISFVRGPAFGFTRQYWTSSGDPTVAFDSKGIAYYVCQSFNRTPPTANEPDLSGLYLYRSQNGGASWQFPGRPISESARRPDTALEDKQLMTADANPSSPYADRLYVTWTQFRTDGTGPIVASYSADHGETWSPQQDISGTSAALCTVPVPGTPAGSCNANQFSQPFTGPDGSVYVVYQNFNNATHPVGDGDGGGGDGSRRTKAVDPNQNRNQILLVKSSDGGVTWSAPVKVADFYDLPDCVTYTGLDAGRNCVPTAGSNGVAGSSPSFFRAENYAVGAVDPHDPTDVYVTIGSYISARSKEPGCTPTGFNPDTGGNRFAGVGVPGGCNNEIVLSESRDGGASFTGTTADVRTLPVLSADPHGSSDQFWQWATMTDDSRLVLSYYDRSRGANQRTGFMDITLTAGTDANNTRFRSRRVTSDPMPPPSQFSGLFMGDYSGLAVSGHDAYPSWTDTRNPTYSPCDARVDPVRLCLSGNDQDAFSARVALP